MTTDTPTIDFQHLQVAVDGPAAARHLDTAVSGTRSVMGSAVREARQNADNVLQWRTKWLMWAALEAPTYDDVATEAFHILRGRRGYGWTEAQAAEVVTGLLEGWTMRGRP